MGDLPASLSHSHTLSVCVCVYVYTQLEICPDIINLLVGNCDELDSNGCDEPVTQSL